MTPNDLSSTTFWWQKFVAKNKALPLMSVVLLLVTLLAVLFSVVVDVSNKLNNTSPLAEQGFLDLRQINLATSQPVPLRGEWQLYWQQLLQSEAFDKELVGTMAIANVPGTWEQQRFHGQQMTSHGYATFRLRIQINSEDSELALNLPKMSSAYRLYVNQRLIDEVGVVSASAQESAPGYSPKLVAVSALQGEIDLVLQISNYDFAWGGMWSAITLSSADNQFRHEFKQAMRSVSIAAIFFTITVLCLFQFALRPTDLLPFIVAVSCILLGIREVETSDVLYLSDTLIFSFNQAVRLNFLTFYLSLPLITLYFHLSFPKEFRTKPIFAICIISMVFSGIVLLTTPATFSQSLVIFQCFALVVLMYGLVAILLAAYRRRVGARLLCFGSLVLFATACNDIFNSMGFINTGITAGFGLLTFVLCQNYMTYVRFINDSEERKSLSLKANQDPLTLLLNRRGLMEAIKIDSAEQRQASAHFCVILLDFDYFKILNDTLGHDAGDEVLAKGSKIMLDVIRKQDLAARWGGEEFVILLPNTELQGAHKLAEKLKQKLSVQLTETLKHRITASLGVAENKDGESFSACLSRADKALYLAKEGGRDRVVLAD